MDEADTSTSSFGNYVCNIFAPTSGNEPTQTVTTSCGTRVLQTIVNSPYSQVTGNVASGTSSCVDPWTSGQPSLTNTVPWTTAECVFSRNFEYEGAMNLQVGDTLQYRAGFNIFAKATDNIPVSKAADPGLLSLVLIDKDSAIQVAWSFAACAFASLAALI